MGKGRQVDTFGARGNPEEGATPTHCHNSWIHPEIFPKVQTSQPIRTSPELNSPSLSINCQPPWPSTWIFPHSHPQPAHKHINPKTNTIPGLNSEAESRELVALWDHHLILTLTKTKEMTVTCYHMDDRLDWRLVKWTKMYWFFKILGLITPSTLSLESQQGLLLEFCINFGFSKQN